MPIRTRMIILAAFAALGFGGAASAHVVPDRPEARAGAFHAAFFRVGHSCGGSPTVSLRLEIPPAVISARPQPKPGWTLSVETEPLPAPRTEYGRTVTERVTAITWTGRLEEDRFDEFGVLLRLPNTPGELVFPALQTCERGELRWDGARPDRPAPRLRLVAPEPEPAPSGHHHH